MHLDPASRDFIEKNKTPVQLVFYFLRQYPWHTVGVITALFISGLMESLGLLALLPVLSMSLEGTDISSAESQRVTDAIVKLVEWFGFSPELSVLLVLIVIIITLKSAFHLLAMGYVGTIMAKIATDLRFSLINSTIQAKWSFFVSKPIGYFTNAVNSEAGLSSSLYMAVCNFVASLTHVILFTGAAMLLNPEIALWALAVGVIMLLTLGRFVTHAKRAGEQQAVAMKGVVRILTDSLQGIKPLKVMGMERFMVPLLAHEVGNLKQAHRRQVLAKHSLNDLREPFIVFFVCIGLYVAVEKMGLAMSGLIVMALIFHRSLNAVGRLQQNFQQIRSAENFFRSLQNTIEEAEDAAETNFAGEKHRLVRSIHFDKVGFSFGEHCILDHQSFEIEAGKLTVIIGPSGAGKSTLLDLLIGLYQVDSGTVYIDETPLKNIDQKYWRQSIGYVPQELFLFHDSILNNITLGDEGLDEDSVMVALRRAGALEFVENLPSGIHTMIGERGARLSGGQRQRIAIARALARNPKLLILDEATTALDPETERQICETLLELGDEITVVAISHQEAIADVAEEILYIENGRVSSKRS